MTSKLLKVTEISTILEISPSKGYTLMWKYVIPIVRIGRSVRVQQEDLETFSIESMKHDFGIFIGGEK
jgi:hypothetical protein